MCENYSKTRACPIQAYNITTSKKSALGSSSCSNQFCTYKDIYNIYTYTSALRLLVASRHVLRKLQQLRGYYLLQLGTSFLGIEK